MQHTGLNKTVLYKKFLLRFRRLFLFSVFLYAAGSSPAQISWLKQMGGAEGDMAVASAADNSGNIYTIGTFSGTCTFGTYSASAAGKGDIFITRTNASGTVDWVRAIGGGNEDNGNAIACDPSGNVYCTGRFGGTVVFGTFTLSATGGADAFLAKIDPATGFVVWAKKTVGTGYDGGLAVTSDALGNIYTSGYFQGTATFGTFTLNPVGTNFNIFITRTDAAGTIVWAKGYGSAGYSYGTAICCDAAGDVYLTGHFESSVNFSSQTVTSVQYEDVFISKHYAATGNTAWAVSAGGPGNDNGYGIAAGQDGYIYTTGKFEETCTFGNSTLSSEGSADIFICKRNATTGILIWAWRFGAAGYEKANALAQDAAGNLFITGQFTGFVSFGDYTLASAGNADAFLAKLDQSGTVLWATSLGGIAVDNGNGITTGADGSLYCTGAFQSTLALAGNSIASAGGTDIFILKLNGATVGINENKGLLNSLQLMPVPFRDELTVTVAGEPLQAYQIRLSDVTGKLLLQLDSEQRSNQLYLGNLDPGIYFITLLGKNGARVTRRILKE